MLPTRTEGNYRTKIRAQLELFSMQQRWQYTMMCQQSYLTSQFEISNITASYMGTRFQPNIHIHETLEYVSTPDCWLRIMIRWVAYIPVSILSGNIILTEYSQPTQPRQHQDHQPIPCAQLGLQECLETNALRQSPNTTRH